MASPHPQPEEEAPNPGWYPQAYPLPIQSAYSDLQRLLKDKGYVLADTMDPRGRKAVEAKTARCLFEILGLLSESFPSIISDLSPADQPVTRGLGARYLAPNVRLASHLERYLEQVRVRKKEADALVIARQQWDAQAYSRSKYEEEGRRIKEERARKRLAEEEGAQAPTGRVAPAGDAEDGTVQSQEARRLQQEAQAAAFLELSGGPEVLEAFLRMEVEPSQVYPECDEGAETANAATSIADEMAIEYPETQVTPTKRLREVSPSGSSPKKPRMKEDPWDTEACDFGVAKAFSEPLRSRLPPSSTLPQTDGMSPLRTANSSTTVPIMAQTTTGMTGENCAAGETSTWVPRPALPAAERDVLIVLPNPHQDVLYDRQIPFYVQWDMSRLIAKHQTVTWADVTTEDFDFFRLPDAALRVAAWLESIASRKAGIDSGDTASPRLSETITGRRRRMLLELQREDESILRNDLRGVLSADPDWTYGGKVAFVVTVSPATGLPSDEILLPGVAVPATEPGGSNPFVDRTNAKITNTLPFLMTLNAPDMPGKSFRLARRFGSRRVLQFRLKGFKSAADKSRLKDLFVGRRFLLFGRTYRALWSPPDRDSVFAIETPEGYQGPDPLMPTFSEVLASEDGASTLCPFADSSVQRHGEQAISGCGQVGCSTAILFSDSVPVVQVEHSKIGSARDIVSSQAKSYEQARTEQTLTDGCGLMSQSLARHLRPNGSGPPLCAVQIRLGGAKGMLAVMNDDQERLHAGRDVILRDSMIKALPDWRFANDPSLLTVDVVRFDGLRNGTSLSSEAIVVLHDRGVPAETLLRMGAESLNTLSGAFLPEPTQGERAEHVLVRLVNSCFRQGGVGVGRKRRQVAAEGSSGRVAGLAHEHHRKVREDVVQHEDSDELVSPSEQYEIDPVNKQPGSLGESLMMALASGFHPKSSQYTCQKLRTLVASLSDTMIRKFRISVDRSITAFIIPDSLQILKPDEVFISFSTRLPIDPDTQCHISHLEGPVLAFRSPCKLPTDVRKCTAVYRPELAYLKDCVVMSAKADFCARSPASYLGGGDYDGDTVQVFWDPALVEPFSNALDEYAGVPDGFVKENFEKEVLKVGEFLQGLDAAGADEETRIANQQVYLLGAIEDDMATGSYSDLHGSAVYELGLSHPETVRLARMFCHVLDARKSGLKVKHEIKRKDDRRYGYQVAWRNWKKEIDDTRNGIACPRRATMGPFIASRSWVAVGRELTCKLDLLMEANITHRGKMMMSFPETVGPTTVASADCRDLSRLWMGVQARITEEATFEAHSRTDDTAAASQLACDASRLQQHVLACHRIWLEIWRSRLPLQDLAELYRSHIEAHTYGASIPVTPSSKSTASTPRHRGASSAAGDYSALLRLTQKRQLAQIWRDAIRAHDVPTLSYFGDVDCLRRIKVSCGAFVAAERQMFVFDMDFETTCELKAKATGATTTIMEDVFMSMKTDYKRPGD